MVFGKAKKQQVSFHTMISNKKELSEIEKILYRLDGDEKVLCVARQSRIKPGGSNITTPNTIFATDKRLIIRNPTMLGMRENVEDYSYDKITNIKLEKGVFSSTLVITAPGMGTASRTGRSNGLVAWGRGEDGMIDAIPKDKAEQLLDIIRNGMESFKKPNNSGATSSSMADELVKYAKLKEQGVLTDEEFNRFKQDLLDKISQAKESSAKIID